MLGFQVWKCSSNKGRAPCWGEPICRISAHEMAEIVLQHSPRNTVKRLYPKMGHGGRCWWGILTPGSDSSPAKSGKKAPINLKKTNKSEVWIHTPYIPLLTIGRIVSKLTCERWKSVAIVYFVVSFHGHFCWDKTFQVIQIQGICQVASRLGGGAQSLHAPICRFFLKKKGPFLRREMSKYMLVFRGYCKNLRFQNIFPKTRQKTYVSFRGDVICWFLGWNSWRIALKVVLKKTSQLKRFQAILLQ